MYSQFGGKVVKRKLSKKKSVRRRSKSSKKTLRKKRSTKKGGAYNNNYSLYVIEGKTLGGFLSSPELVVIRIQKNYMKGRFNFMVDGHIMGTFKEAHGYQMEKCQGDKNCLLIEYYPLGKHNQGGYLKQYKFRFTKGNIADHLSALNKYKMPRILNSFVKKGGAKKRSTKKTVKRRSVSKKSVKRRSTSKKTRSKRR